MAYGGYGGGYAAPAGYGMPAPPAPPYGGGGYGGGGGGSGVCHDYQNGRRAKQPALRSGSKSFVF